MNKDILNVINSNDKINILYSQGIDSIITFSDSLIRSGHKIFVIVNFINNVDLLYNYHKSLNLKYNIGFAVFDSQVYDNKSNVIYMTTKYINYLFSIHDKILNIPDIIILCDTYENKYDNILFLKLFDQYSYNLGKLIVFSQYPSLISNFVKYDMRNIYYDININYTIRNYSVNDTDLLNDIFSLLCDSYKLNKNNNMVVLLPDIDMINIMLNKIEKCPLEIIAYSLYDIKKISMSDINCVYLTTHNLISPFKLNNISIVIDSMIENVIKYTDNGGIRFYNKYINKNKAIASLSYLGQNLSGTCYRMMTKDYYDYRNSIGKDSQDLPLTFILDMIKFKINPYILTSYVNEYYLNLSTDILVNIGCIKNNKLTDMGVFCLNYPLGIRNSALLFYCIQNKFPLFESIVIASLIDCSPGYFTFPLKTDNIPYIDYIQYRSRYIIDNFDKFKGYSDLHTYFNIWNNLYNSLDVLNTSNDNIYNWCINNKINFNKILDLISTILQCISITTKLGYDVDIISLDHSDIMSNIIKIIDIVYSDLKFELKNDDIFNLLYVDPITNLTHKLSIINSINNLSINPNKFIYALNTSTVSSQTGDINIINVLFAEEPIIIPVEEPEDDSDQYDDLYSS